MVSTLRKPSRWSVLIALARRAQRSRLLPVAGIIIGILAAGAGLFRKTAPPVTNVPPGYIALVNGKGVLMSDFISQTQTEMERPFDQTTHAERMQVLGEMIDTELMVQRGLVLDLPLTTVEVRDVMQDSVISQVAAPVLSNEPSKADLRNYYIAHREKYTADGSMLVHDLVLHIGGYENIDQTQSQALTDATAAVYQLRAGASINYIKEHFGFVDSGRARKIEELDFAAKIHLGDQLFSVASKLRTGQVSDPVVAADGIHVLIMDVRKPPQLATYDKVQRKVFLDYRQAQIKRATQDNLAILRSRAHILVLPQYSQ